MMGSTSVDLGFIETDYESWEVESRHFPSKVGGKPAWLDLKHLPSPDTINCPYCHQPRVFLLQVYAPDNDVSDAFHRSIFVFICKKDSCWTQSPPPILVLRSQLARDNPYYPYEPPQDGPDWRSDLVVGVQCPVCVVCGARGDLRCARCRAVCYCGQGCQKLDWRSGHKRLCQEGGQYQPSNVNWVLKEGLLEMEEEPDKDVKDPKDDMYKDMVDNALSGASGANMDVGDEEWAEIEAGQREDKFAEKFRARLRRCPDQVLRYDRRGDPLLCSSTPLAAPPPCGACGGQRTFEFQVMPQLLSELKLGSDTCEVGGVDWGSLHVYTCDQSCHVTEGYVAEYVQLQQFELSNIPGT